MIELASGLRLPESAVTNSYALLAMKGAGKSNAAVVFAEQLYAAAIPWVCIDPKGDWWGIRSSANGKRDGLAVPIFGGLHADVPLDPGAGVLFADLVVDQHLTCLIDVSEFTKGESIRFLTAFFDRLYRRKNRSTYPMHLFLEECDDYVPQKVYRELAALVRTVELCVKRGRQRGLGITLASQRAASVNKDVLTQTDTMMVLRTTSPQDRKAIEDWINWHAGSRSIVDELPTMRDGEAWISSPAQLRILKKVQFRKRSTFDSGATPELGERVRAATLADIDVAAITTAVASVVEKARADDPKRLRARIAELERDTAKAATPAAPVVEVREVEVPIVPPGVVDALQRTLAEYDTAIANLQSVRRSLIDAQKVMEKMKGKAPPRTGRLRPEPSSTSSPRVIATPRPTPPRANSESSTERLGKREDAILRVLATHGERTEKQLAMLCGYSAKASTIGAGLSALRKLGFVEGRRITQAGLDHLGDTLVELPTGQELLEYWRGELGPDSRERKILEVLLGAWPEEVGHDAMCEATGYRPTASTVGAGMSKLRRLGLVKGWRLSDEFHEAIE